MAARRSSSTYVGTAAAALPAPPRSRTCSGRYAHARGGADRASRLGHHAGPVDSESTGGTFAGRLTPRSSTRRAPAPASPAAGGSVTPMGNRLVALVLRSPLHRLLSGSLLLLSVTGRRSGQRHTFPVSYLREDDRVVVLVGNAESKRWWRNLVEPAAVGVLLRGRRRHGTGRLATGTELDEALLAYLQRHPGAWRALGVGAAASGEDVGHAAARATVVIIDLDPQHDAAAAAGT